MTVLFALFFALFSLVFTCLAEVVTLRPSPKIQDLAERPSEYRFLPPISDPASDISGDLDLLDIVLVASVDGKFHALNRTSGQPLWSMSSTTSPLPANASVPSALGPLIRTKHVEYDPDLTDKTDVQETYVIEPQSGAIFVMTNPSSPLKRFPFSMPELVEMSPFSFSGDEGGRVFVGRKETSLLLIELETGRVKATLNSECPWDPFEEFRDTTEVDLDELEGSKPQTPESTEVFIGRTDYYISIYTRPHKNSPSQPRPPVQNLSFSSYGPNNQDNHLQTSYKRTKDDAYIQSLPSGEIFAFKAKSKDSKKTNESPLLWMKPFNNPIVAVFDVLKRSPSSTTYTRNHPFVLQQPRSRLQDVLPNFSSPSERLPNADSAYVGIVEESGSLFAMSPELYPLVVFTSASLRNKKLIDGPKPSHSDSLDVEIDDFGMPSQMGFDCHPEVIGDKRCLLGVRKIEEGEWPLKRLIEAGQGHARVERAERPSITTVPIHAPGPEGVFTERRNSGGIVGTIDSGEIPEARRDSMSEIVFITLLLGIISAWLSWRRLKEKMVKGITTLDTVSMALTLSETPKEEKIANGNQEVREREIEISAKGVSESSSGTSGNGGLEQKPVSTPPSVDMPSPIFGASTVVEEGDETDREDGESEAPTPGKKKVRRGRRGKKKKVGIVLPNGAENKHSSEEQPQQPTPQVPRSIVVPPSLPPVSSEPSLIVSDTILGFGSHGTVVFKGSLQGRAVAVKRLLRDFVTLASREVSILQESDDHPNVIRYYYQEAHANFLYIALELCPASLADIIESPDRDQWRDIAVSFDPKRALKQITGGLKHLHALKLVHRDIKPQNILISSTKPGRGPGGGYRMLISDFGLCKKLDVDQTSFAPTAYGAMAAGTVGWRAPEILRGEVKLDEIGDDASLSSRGSVATVMSAGGTSSNSHSSGRPRLTKTVDIFALGCLFYYTLTSGGHPFGDKYEREVNILKDAKSLKGLERFGEEGSEAVDLITQMLNPEASQRPDTNTCLIHPFFWDSARRLNFLQDASDRFEIMCREPKDPYLLALENDAFTIVGNDWHTRMDKIFIENLGKFRKYDGKSVQDLLRALRNKKHHYQDIPENVKRHLGSMPDGFLSYFTRRFPNLFLHVHGVIRTTGLRSESMFRSYFDLPD
ncbi:hypothetical protein AMATHDRAFT_54469 [Amanita thiersii Skay4041]|uniref:non-specific serine/threonine protein kinase n=1 Tax=Amanita thiersii Skay4041 TaxID=703135 RepID=A0A2A9NSD0_9AGAR|nr:hypothetical protein AMATHDRAFT_54469 [Amanita thiersii Skay4041]